MLLGGRLSLAVNLGPSLNGPHVVGIIQDQLLLFELGDEFGPALLDGIMGKLEEAVNESDLRTGIEVLRCWINLADPNQVHNTVHAEQRALVGIKRSVDPGAAGRLFIS
ncbi:hypothetical protein [Bradyrhizobium sp. McL0615]|uniref:hypothetical protein n=1 Tax=Bradyrhizobium sp. McL0615 TaxID=3415673 RepID=UPI003CF18AB2